MSRLNDVKLAAESAPQPLSTEELLLQATAVAMDAVLQETPLSPPEPPPWWYLDGNGLPYYPECEVGENTEPIGGQLADCLHQ